MSARDELSLELFIGDNGNQSREQSIVDWQWFNEKGNHQGRIEHYNAMADAVLAAGYRKPRAITTAEELDALPNGSVVLDAIAYTWQRMDSGNWVSWLNPGETSAWMAAGKRGPFTLIHETSSNESWLTAHQEGTR